MLNREGFMTTGKVLGLRSRRQITFETIVPAIWMIAKS
jgi:hypothetical protein